MEGTIFVIALVSTVGGIAFLIVTVTLIYKLIARRQDSRILNDEEGRMLQEIWLGLEKMDQRVANLETILIQKDRKP
jgi:phage shock protein B